MSGDWNPAYAPRFKPCVLPCMRLYHSDQRTSLSDFYPENIGPVAPSGVSKMLRNPVLKCVFPLSLFLSSLPQFLRNLIHFTMVSGRCDEGILGLERGVVAGPHRLLLKWLQPWQHDTCWATCRVTMRFQFTSAGLLEGRIGFGGMWGVVPTLDLIMSLGWYIVVTREAYNSEARLPGFES